ncbi:MAG: chromate resistance protein ChrB domain-containing protein, partial [Stellaceae bacterium]
MDGSEGRISPAELYESLGTGAAPLLIDVRRPEDYDADDALIVGAVRRLPDRAAEWCPTIAEHRAIVVYDASGGPASQRVAATLAAAGLRASYVEGGIAAWRELRLPTRRRVGRAPGRWITRERPTIDRIACPWLISRFIDPEAEFVYVPTASVIEAAEQSGATPYDV